MCRFATMTDSSDSHLFEPLEKMLQDTKPAESGRCICLDAEFVEGEELIELSIFDLSRKPLYYSRFKPERYKQWDSSIHGIKPDMVADAPSFASELPAVQRIINDATYMIGFAVENDISHLRSQGITGLNDKHIIELRNWYWINHGIQAGIDLFQGVSLASVVESLELNFGEEGMHSASGDTLATLDSFLLLYSRFRSERNLGSKSFEEAVRLFDEEFAREKLEYDRTHAEGYAVLLRMSDGCYGLRIRREEPRQSSRIVAVIKVADRQRAGVELRNMFAKRPQPGKGIYRLKESDIERFRQYANDFDSDDHAIFKKLQGLSERFNVSGLKRR